MLATALATGPSWGIEARQLGGSLMALALGSSSCSNSHMIHRLTENGPLTNGWHSGQQLNAADSRTAGGIGVGSGLPRAVTKRFHKSRRSFN